MSLKSHCNVFHTQFFLSFVSLLALTYLSCCFAGFVSLVGQLIVISSLAWHLTKIVRKRLNNEVITSYKRAVLVTGCDSGFGNALAYKLNENGYRVYATVLNPESESAKKLVTGSRFEGKTHVLRMDVTKDNEVQTVYERVRTELRDNGEELWAVVNNAGVIEFGPFDWGTIDSYKQVFEVNTFGMVRVTRTFLPLLRQSKGRIVNLVSIAGRETSTILPIYSMSKHASISFSDAIRRELRKYGIRVSTVEPMPYKTQMATNEFFERQVERIWANTSDEVKQVYGEDYYRKFRKYQENLTGIYKPGENIYEVVDLLLDGVRSPDPQVRYGVIAGSCFIKAFFYLLRSLPIEMKDMLTFLRDRKAVKPVFLKNEQ